MIQKGSYLQCSDKNGVLLVGVFHLYGGFYKKFSVFGSFVKISVKQVLSSFLVLKKSKFKAIIILSKSSQKKKDSSTVRFKVNSCVVLKRRMTPLGKEVIGPCNYSINRKRFVYSFAYVL